MWPFSQQDLTALKEVPFRPDEKLELSRQGQPKRRTDTPSWTSGTFRPIRPHSVQRVPMARTKLEALQVRVRSARPGEFYAFGPDRPSGGDRPTDPPVETAGQPRKGQGREVG